MEYPSAVLMQAQEEGFDPSFFLMMGAIFLIFYFLVIRPQQRQQKEREESIRSLVRGDRVVTSGGLHGVVTEVGDDSVLLCGMAEKPAVAFMDHGAKGYSSGLANFVPKLSLALHAAYFSGDRAEVERIHALMVPFEDIRSEGRGKYTASAIHVALERIGLAGGPVIPMQTDVATEDLERIQELTDALMRHEETV